MGEYRIGFLGTGNMAGAILNGIIKSGDIKPSNIYIYDPDDQKTAPFTKCGVCAEKSNIAVARKVDFLFLCIKPQMFSIVAEEFDGQAELSPVVVSIMAGVPIARIKSVFPESPVIRIMPNTPLLLAKGASALCSSEDVSAEKFDFIFDIFSSMGTAVRVDETLLSAVTALSGSGPAYFFRFARAAINKSVELGIPYDTALSLLAQTMIGSAHMLTDSEKTPDELIRMVTSPKGTTLAASEVFDARGFETAIAEAMQACYNRSEELSKNS